MGVLFFICVALSGPKKAVVTVFSECHGCGHWQLLEPCGCRYGELTFRNENGMGGVF